MKELTDARNMRDGNHGNGVQFSIQNNIARSKFKLYWRAMLIIPGVLFQEDEL